jgi:hypothetical protein
MNRATGFASALAAFVCVASSSDSVAADPANERSYTKPVDTLTWRKQAPDLPILISELWGKRDEDGGFGELVQLPPGFNSGLHAHSGDFHGVLLKGIWVHEIPNGVGKEQRLLPGSYVRQAGGGMHIDRCVSEEPCVLFLFQYARADVIWPD